MTPLNVVRMRRSGLVGVTGGAPAGRPQADGPTRIYAEVRLTRRHSGTHVLPAVASPVPSRQEALPVGSTTMSAAPAVGEPGVGEA